MLQLIAVLLLAGPLAQPPAPACTSREECRAAALIAEAAGDFERFHDLAWRAVQKGSPNDPELMELLARAMARSGRPGDAIVMLSRLADMGVKPDVSGDEFSVVRTLKDWPDVAAKIDAVPDAAAAGTAAAPASAAPDPAAKPAGAEAGKPAAPEAKRAPARPKKSPETPAAPAPVTSAAAPPAEAAAAPLATAKEAAPAPKAPEAAPTEAEPAAMPEPEAALEYEAPDLVASALAYDAVSRRFVVADRAARKLLIIDEQSRHVVTMVGAAAAGFYDDLAGLRIDARRGDLWVVSSRAEGDGHVSRLNKIQLVSGRTIFDVDPAAALGDVQLVDVDVSATGTVYALDAAGGRVLRLPAGARAFEVAGHLTTTAPRALAVADDRAAYVADSEGLIRLDLGTSRPQRVRSSARLSGITALEVRNKGLFALQDMLDGSGRQLIRLTLDAAGRRVTQSRRIDEAAALTVAGNRVFYVASPGLIRSFRAR